MLGYAVGLQREQMAAITGEGGELDHVVIKRTPAMVGFSVEASITVYTRNGEVEAEPGDLLVADKTGCWVVTPR